MRKFNVYNERKINNEMKRDFSFSKCFPKNVKNETT